MSAITPAALAYFAPCSLEDGCIAAAAGAAHRLNSSLARLSLPGR